MSEAMIFDIAHGSFVDGPGIRTTVFFKGCNLNCAWCHNPEGRSFQRQMMVYRDRCTDCGKCRAVCREESCVLCGRCAMYCPADARKVCGARYTAEEVLTQILQDKVFYETSGGGVTFSGGECMLQLEFLTQMLKACKANGIHTAVDTAGYVPFESFEAILPYTDLFLYDIKLADSPKHKTFVGVENDRILENLQRLFAAGANILIRIPVIGGVNDSLEEMQAIKAFLDRCGRPVKIELLPYHPMGQSKSAAIGAPVQLFRTPDAETMARLEAIFGA